MLGETAEFYSPNIKQLYRDLGLKVMRQYFMALNKKNNVTDKVSIFRLFFIQQYILDKREKSQTKLNFLYSTGSFYLPEILRIFVRSKIVFTVFTKRILGIFKE